MNTRLVLPVFSHDSWTDAVRARSDAGREVIAVALDLREEFALEVLVPTLREETGDPVPRLDQAARAFVEDRLRDIAIIEEAKVEPLLRPVPWARTPNGLRDCGLALIDLCFTRRVPIALNDVPMTIVELMESVETISGVSAVSVLRQAFETLGTNDSGHVRLQAERGACRVALSAAAV